MGMCKPSGGINKTIYGPVRENIEKNRIRQIQERIIMMK